MRKYLQDKIVNLALKIIKNQDQKENQDKLTALIVLKQQKQKENQKKFINYLVKDLFNTIDENDILQMKNVLDQQGRVLKRKGFIRGKEISHDKLLKLKDDAKNFKSSTIWRVLNDEVKFVSNQRMFIKGKDGEDLLAGKMALYILEVINKKIEEISKY